MHVFEPHTSEVAVRFESRSPGELFIEAGIALAQVILGRDELPDPGPGYYAVSLKAPDRDALLVDWMNELIYRTEHDGRLYTKFTIERLTDRELEAGIQGTEAPDLRSVVKAATFHGLRTTETPRGLTATVVLDV